jgi:hypothetical protein
MEFDPLSNVWIGPEIGFPIAPLPTARVGLGAAVVGKRLFALGGQLTDGGLNAFEAGDFREPPPSVSIGGPYSVPSGGGVQLGSSGSDPSGSALSFAWDLSGLLLFDTPGQNPTFSVAGLAPGEHAIHVRALATHGSYAVASTTVTVTAPVKLAFATQPGSVQAGSPFSPQPVVQALDAQGRVVPGFTGQVSIAFGTNAGAGILGGTPNRNAVNGVTTFTDLFVNAPGAGYTLVASAPGLASATSAPFTIMAPCAPRPNVGIATAKAGTGQLQAVLTAQTNVATTSNSLSSVRIISASNATVQVNGSPVAVGDAVSLAAGTTQATLLVERTAPGGGSTVSFTVTDVCGEWRSFVGGGPGAF